MTAADRPTVTDNARAEAERHYPAPNADDETLTYPRSAVREHARGGFVKGYEAGWAAGRAEATTEATDRTARQIAATTAMPGLNAREYVNAARAIQRAETTTAHECDSGDFDRTICGCGAMHSYCTGCGTRQDDCRAETTTATPEDAARVTDDACYGGASSPQALAPALAAAGPPATARPRPTHTTNETS